MNGSVRQFLYITLSIDTVLSLDHLSVNFAGVVQGLETLAAVRRVLLTLPSYIGVDSSIARVWDLLTPTGMCTFVCHCCPHHWHSTSHNLVWLIRSSKVFSFRKWTKKSYWSNGFPVKLLILPWNQCKAHLPLPRALCLQWRLSAVPLLLFVGHILHHSQPCLKLFQRIGLWHKWDGILNYQHNTMGMYPALRKHKVRLFLRCHLEVKSCIWCRLNLKSVDYRKRWTEVMAWHHWAQWYDKKQSQVGCYTVLFYNWPHLKLTL